MAALDRETTPPAGGNGNGKDRLGALRETAATLTAQDWDWHDGLKAFQQLCWEFDWAAETPTDAKQARFAIAEFINRMDLVKPWSAYTAKDFEDLIAGARLKHAPAQDEEAEPEQTPEPDADPEPEQPSLNESLRIITITVGYSRKVSANYQSVEAHAGATVECQEQDAHATFAAAYELVRREVEQQLNNDTSTERN